MQTLEPGIEFPYRNFCWLFYKLWSPCVFRLQIASGAVCRPVGAMVHRSSAVWFDYLPLGCSVLFGKKNPQRKDPEIDLWRRPSHAGMPDVFYRVGGGQKNCLPPGVVGKQGKENWRR